MTIIKDHQLQILQNEFDLIAKNTVTQLEILKKVIVQPSLSDLYEKALANEIIIDRLELKIREEVAFTIFKFTPVAEDLRRIIAYQDITTNMERVADMVLNIMGYLQETDLSSRALTEIHKILEHMLDDVTMMLRNAVLSFTSQNLETAYKVIAQDDSVDEMYHDLKVHLTEAFSGRTLTASEVQQLITLETIAYNLERCGDSATNIAEASIYLTKGKDIRHIKKLDLYPEQK